MADDRSREHRVVPIVANQTAVTGGLQLQARPRILLGAEPPATTQPLPTAAAVAAGNSFHVTMPVDVGYASIDQQLRQALALDSGGTYFPPTGKKRVRIVAAQIYAYGRQAVTSTTCRNLRSEPSTDANLALPRIARPRKTIPINRRVLCFSPSCAIPTAFAAD